MPIQIVQSAYNHKVQSTSVGMIKFNAYTIVQSTYIMRCRAPNVGMSKLNAYKTSVSVMVSLWGRINPVCRRVNTVMFGQHLV